MPFRQIFAFYFFLSISPKVILNAFPTSDGSRPAQKLEIRGNDETTTTTTESANATETFISSVWHKISNIFGTETTTQSENEVQHEILRPAEDRMPLPVGNERELRMAPMDFSRRKSEENMWQREGEDEGNPFPIHPLRMARSDFELEPEENERGTDPAEVSQREMTRSRTKRLANQSDRERVPVIFEEFIQGDIEGGRIKRFNIQKSTDWRTEKIVEGSDPVENIDKENYIESAKDSDFPFHSISMKPIIVEDNISIEVTTTLTQKELPPLQIIES